MSSWEVIPKDWAKRRVGTPSIPVKDVIVPGFKKEHNHFCNMYVEFIDGTKQTYYSRVLQNGITKRWVVDGMWVAIRLVE